MRIKHQSKNTRTNIRNTSIKTEVCRVKKLDRWQKPVPIHTRRSTRSRSATTTIRSAKSGKKRRSAKNRSIALSIPPAV